MTVPDGLLRYSDLDFRSAPVDVLYHQAKSLAAPKPIYFKLDEELIPNAAAREFTDFWLVWIRVRTPEKLAHELAHIIVELTDHTPVLDPDEPGGREREFLGNVIGLLDHPVVHEMLRQAGLDDRHESRTALASYLAEAKTLNFQVGQVHPFMAVGFANMCMTHSPNDRVTFGEIEKAFAERSPETLGAGRRIIKIIAEREAHMSADTTARRVCDNLGIRPSLRNAIWPWDRKALRRY